MCVRKAFTLVEMLVVVLILAVLAAIVLPAFSNASAVARASMLADDLRVFRTHLQVFKGQHRGVSAGYPNCDPAASPTEAAFVAHMTMASTWQGQTAAPGTAGYEHGPYLREIPPNPVNGKTSAEMIPDGSGFPSSADDTHGWVYQPSTLTFRGDSVGSADTGKDYFEY